MPSALMTAARRPYDSLHDELHARPFVWMETPAAVTHLAVLRDGVDDDALNAHLADLFRHFDTPRPANWTEHFMAELGDIRLRVERHTEFTSYTFHQAVVTGVRQHCVLEALPAEWLQRLPGEILVRLHIGVERQPDPDACAETLGAFFGDRQVVGGHLIDRSASVWTDYRLDDYGFLRFVVQDHELTAWRAGRLVQRLLELENYRMMAMLALPVARRVAPQARELDQRLSARIAGFTRLQNLDEERALLNDLTALAVETENLRALTSHRFAAARAYHEILDDRLAELRESEVPGYQTLSEFLDRRITPAMRTCRAVGRHLQELSARIDRATDLLRTRVNLNVEAQNQNLLASLDRRHGMQLRLQQTVEGLSVAAVSYYISGLAKYSFEGLKAAGWPINPYVATGICLPLIVLIVWRGLHHVKGRLQPD